MRHVLGKEPQPHPETPCNGHGVFDNPHVAKLRQLIEIEHHREVRVTVRQALIFLVVFVDHRPPLDGFGQVLAKHDAQDRLVGADLLWRDNQEHRA